MEPVHFGSESSPLFGAYHPPQTGYSSSGYLLCNAFGQEAIRLFRCYREIALRLSASGMHCFRFDYRGCGDSYGSDSDYSLTGWIDDIQSAAKEFRDISGIDQVSFIGARLGASLALKAARSLSYPTRVIAIDPVVNGARLLDEQREAHAMMCVDANRFATPRRVAEAPQDLLGFRVHPGLRDDLTKLDLTDELPKPDIDVNVIVSDIVSDAKQLCHHLSTGQKNEIVPSQINFDPHWNDAAYLEQTLIAPNLVSEVCRLASK